MGALTRVIEFSSLSYAQSSTTYDQDFLHAHEVACAGNGTAVKVGLRIWSFLSSIPATRDLGEGSELLLLYPRFRWVSNGRRGEGAISRWDSSRTGLTEQKARGAAGQTSTGGHWSR